MSDGTSTKGPTLLSDSAAVGLVVKVHSFCQASVCKTVDVVIEADHGTAVRMAALGAPAALNPHEVMVEGLSVRALEAESHCTG